MPRLLRSARIPSVFGLMAVCVTAAACGVGEPTLAASGADPGPTPNLQRSLEHEIVEHHRAHIVPTLDWRAAAIERAPMALTAGDGSGLELVSVSGTVVIEDPLAFTELHLTFENPEARRREGRFEFDLPHGAALSRLAMRIGKKWMEGEVIERARARETFESYLHWRPRVDPALLEKAAANRVSARVFPILPHERKEIIISYSQPLIGGDESYRLPLQGLPTLGELDVRVIVKTTDAQTEVNTGLASLASTTAAPPAQPAAPVQRVVELHERNFQPSQDLVVALTGAGDAGALRADELVAVRVRPRLADTDLADKLDSLSILFDTSASSAASYDREIDRLGAMLGALGEAPVRIIAFDQEVELIHEGPASEALGTPLAALRERRAFGASNLEAALSHELLRSATHRRLLVWSDGLATAGEIEGAPLAKLAQGLGLERIDAYATSSSADRNLLTELATAAGRAGTVVGPALEGAAVLEAIERPGFDAVQIRIAGADWSYPRTLEGFAPGDDVVVLASFPYQAPDEIYVGFSDPRVPDHVVPTLDGAVPLVLRAVAQARVDELQHKLEHSDDPAESERLREQLVGLAVDNRLLTNHTALLVLENESEYQRYGIQRSARRDILTIGAEGVDLLRRGGGPSQWSRGTGGGGGNNLDTKETPPPSSLFSMRGPNTAPAKSEDAQRLAMLQQQAGHFMAAPDPNMAITGGSSMPGQLDEDVYGGLGVGGLGLSGTGRGGGGTGEGTIGLGNTGLIGKGGGGGTGSGYGRGSGAGFGGRGLSVPRVRQAKATVSGSLDADIIRRIVRAHINEVRSCYNNSLTKNPKVFGRVEIDFTILQTGRVSSAQALSNSTGDASVANCIAKASMRWKFPKPRSGVVRVRYPFVLSPGSGSSRSSMSSMSSMFRGNGMAMRSRRRPGQPSDPNGVRWSGTAQSGRYGEIQSLVATGRFLQARTDAWNWATSEPDNSLAMVALGEMLELEGDRQLAARVYGSLIDLHPQRADVRRTAAARLETFDESAHALAIDSYRKAIAQRPDQINGHRLLAWALAKHHRYEEAFEILGQAIATDVPNGRFNGVKSLLREDQRLVAAAWLASAPASNVLALEARLRAAGVRPAVEASMRLVANWETDATDVDILVDPIGPGDGHRHADVRMGFGPEAWIARGSRSPASVVARVRYFNRGAMGYAMGTVSAIVHDGAGNLSFRDRPFVLMNGSGSVELGRFGD